MIRFFVSESNIYNKRLLLDKEEYHYLNNVIKLTTGSKMELVVDKSKVIVVMVKEFLEDSIFFEKETEFLLRQNKSLINITLAQCLPKQDKMSDILKKCTQIGVNIFIPIISSRVISRFDEKRALKKKGRWDKVLESAASQSKRDHIPDLLPVLELDTFLGNQTGVKGLKNSKYDLKLVCWEEEKNNKLKMVLRDYAGSLNIKEKKEHSILVFIGPEGGLAVEEVQKLKNNNFISVSIGKTVLRVENAGFSACSNILYEFS
ncbi:MAG: 16S rRNA (uracil(1498)-N(3))-methyltransferase [bacterium]|nr:16S rRNA (uracil(1498)-N(3))-methyltransferase [bacterium]